jgi:hypothetical protein
MKKIISSILTILVMVNFAFATDKAIKTKVTSVLSITGKVVDKITGEGLAGAEIKLIGSDIKVYTDFDGNFTISNIPAGAQAIKINYISYEQTVENVFTSNNDNKTIVIKLKNVQK